MKHDKDLQAAVERQWEKEYEDHIGEPRPTKRRRFPKSMEEQEDEPQSKEVRDREWGGIDQPEQTQ